MDTRKPTIVFTAQPGAVRDELWGEDAVRAAADLGYDVRLNPAVGSRDPAYWREFFADADAIITTWGAPCLDEEVLGANTRLRIVGHAAGSVANLVSDYLYDRGVRVVTANRAMARSVAEWNLMMTFVAARRLGRYAVFGGRSPVDPGPRSVGRAIGEVGVGIWGYGDVARSLIAMLRPLGPRRLAVCDEYLSVEDAAAEGVEKVNFEELFRESDIVHTLTGLTEANTGRVNAAVIATMKPGAVLINAGRAPLIERAPFLAALREGRIEAILDVHYREPVPDDDPFLTLPNVMMTPHCAGYPGRGRYVPLVLEEFARFFRGAALEHEITRERAAAMTDATILKRFR